MKIIFLDIDGVLHPSTAKEPQDMFQPAAMKVFAGHRP